MTLVVVATSPTQIFNAGLYVKSQRSSFEDTVLLMVRSRQEGDNALARSMAARDPWAVIRMVPFYETHLQEEERIKSAESTNHDTHRARSRWSGLSRLLMKARRNLSRRASPGDIPTATREGVIEPECPRSKEIASRQAYCRGLDSITQDLGIIADTIVLGDYRPITFRLLMERMRSPETSIVLVDDGAVMRHVIRFRNDEANPDEITRHVIRRLSADDPFVFYEPTSMTLFTIYDDCQVPASDRLIRNDFYDRHALNRDVEEIEEVWIVGGNHVEAGIATAWGYEQNMLAVTSWFPSRRVVYFPHRRESEQKVRRIRKLCNVEIRAPDFGMENYAIENAVRPAAILSFGSTVVDTLSRLYRDTDVKIAVIVPTEGYFSKSARIGHVRSVIRDNIAANDGVVGLYAGYNNEAWFRRDRSVVGRRSADETGPIVMPSFEVSGTQSLTVERTVNGVRARETSRSGLHALILGEYDIETGFCSSLGLVSEGRSVFRIRVTSIDAGRSMLDIRFDCDRSGNYAETSDMGSLRLACVVSEDRKARMIVVFQPSRSGRYEFKLITQRSGASSSLYPGMSDVGFRTEHFESKRDAHAVQLDMAGRTIFVSADFDGPRFLVFEHHGNQKLVVLTNGIGSDLNRRLLNEAEGSTFSEMIHIGIVVPYKIGGMVIPVPLQLRLTEEGIELENVVIFGRQETREKFILVNGSILPDSLDIIYAIMEEEFDQEPSTSFLIPRPL